MSQSFNQFTSVEDILRAVYSREVSSREKSASTNTRSREELNNITIEQYNNTSRSDSEDEAVLKTPLGIAGQAVVTSSKGFSVKSTAPIQSTAFSGIIVQQCRTKSGIKLAITLQTPEWARTGDRMKVTAELKRYDRLREIKTRLEDSSQFNQFLEDTRRQIHQLKQRDICMGRLHERGKRASWVLDSLVVARLYNDQVSTVILNIEGEEYEINLDQELSPNQTSHYISTGQYGCIQNINSRAPRIWDLPLTKTGD